MKKWIKRILILTVVLFIAVYLLYIPFGEYHLIHKGTETLH